MALEVVGAAGRDSLRAVLAGVAVSPRGRPGRAVGTCAAHLAWLGAARRPEPAVGCVIGGPDGMDGEATAQAVTGLMAVHGRDRGVPRRLGLDVVSVASGIVASQGVLAALIARSRGRDVRGVEVSVLDAGLFLLNHHVTIATSGGDFPPHESGPAPGPPFATADGRWVEVEALSPEHWMAFWGRLGIVRKDVVGRAWLPYVLRYLAGRCALPAELHEATRRSTLAELRGAAESSGVALCPLRTGTPVNGGPEAAPPWMISRHPETPTASATTPASSASRPAADDAPLSGLRVVEATSRMQGPLAGLLLRMLGAEVVKVEPPGGDFGRGSRPLAGTTGAAYLAYNRGKSVVEIDYKSPAGRAEIADLAATADVFLHNWPPGRAGKLGLDAESLHRRNPRLVYAAASGWGGEPEPPSPIAGDYLVQAYAGCGERLNPPGEPPFPTRATIVDATGGLLACEGVLAGIHLRERTGRGSAVETSLLAGARALRAAAPEGLGWDVLDGPLETVDGHLVVDAPDPAARRRLQQACGLDAGATGAVAVERIAGRLRELPAAVWEERLRDAGVPAARVCAELGELPEDPRMKGRLESVNGDCWAPGAPWRFTSNR